MAGVADVLRALRRRAVRFDRQLLRVCRRKAAVSQSIPPSTYLYFLTIFLLHVGSHHKIACSYLICEHTHMAAVSAWELVPTHGPARAASGCPAQAAARRAQARGLQLASCAGQ